MRNLSISFSEILTFSYSELWGHRPNSRSLRYTSYAKPCGLLDVKGYYACLADHMDRMVTEGFMVAEHRKVVLTGSAPADLLDPFETYDPPQVDKWIEKKKGL